MSRLDEIAASLPGFYAEDLHADLASACLAALVEPVRAVETVALEAALDRVLAHAVVSPIDVPAHANAAMDGYAFDGAQLAGTAALALRVVGAAHAGAPWPGHAAAGGCVRILTGALLPEGLDTVVPQELVQRDGELVRFATDKLDPGQHCRAAGEDLRQGEVALAAGARLSPAALGLLASLGMAQVAVLRRPRVAVFSSGNELLTPGTAARAGAVYDSNRMALLGLVRRMGLEAVDLGVVPDNPALLQAALGRAASRCDAVLSSGGVGLGDADHARAMVQGMGDFAFWRIAMRPGRPLAVGCLDRVKIRAKMAPSADAESADSYQNDSNHTPSSCLFLGLPGNPVAALVTFLVFVRPALLRLMGSSAPPPPRLQAASAGPISKRPGRTEFQRGWVQAGADGAPVVQADAQQGSGILSSMVRANALIVLPHERGDVAAGEQVEVVLFDGLV